MNTTPIIILSGQAGSGKDTVASFLVKNHGAIAIAQADPMKALGRMVFDFSEDQLWGPSHRRNAEDRRYDHAPAWEEAHVQLCSSKVQGWLRNLFEKEDLSAEMLALANWFFYLKDITFNAGKPLTPRAMLQTLGTEWGRQQGRDLWSNYAIKTALKLLGGGYKYDRVRGEYPAKDYAGPTRVVLTDGRFRNELINVRAIGGSAIRIDNPNLDTSAVEKAGVAGHASEQEQKSIPGTFFTGFLYNDKSKGLAWVEKRVAELVMAIDSGFVYAGYPSYESLVR